MTLLINPYRFTVPSAVATVTYVGLTTMAGTTATQTAVAVPVGTAAFNRTVFQFVHWLNATSAKTLASATIGGVAATIHAQNSSVAGGGGIGIALISAPLAAGTTADTVLNFTSGAAFYHPYLETYAVTGLISGVAADTVSTIVTSSASYSGVIDVQNQGVLLMGGTLYANVTGYTLSGVTEDYESTVATYFRIAGGSLAVTSTQVNRPVGITITGGTAGAFYGAIVGAAFR